MPLAFGLALGPLVALGFARFSYSLLLPPMRTDLGWSYAQAGAMNTANALGYLAGALLAGPAARALGTRRGFVLGMALAALAMFAAGLTPIFALQLLLRVAAGIGAAATFVGGAVLVAKLGERAPSSSGALLTVYTGGAGLGIVASALAVPPLLAGTGVGGWRFAWFALAALSGLGMLAALPALRRVAEPDSPQVTRERRVLGHARALLLPGFGYLLFGGGYIAYITFVIAYLRAAGFSALGVGTFWAVLGASGFAGVGLWGWLLDRLRSGHSLALANAVLVVGAVLPLLVPGTVAGLVSALLFGSTFLAVPAGMAHLARRRLPPGAWAGAIGALTVAFAVGQSIGPALAGILADYAGGASLGLVVAATALTGAAVVYLLSEIGQGPGSQ